MRGLYSTVRRQRQMKGRHELYLNITIAKEYADIKSLIQERDSVTIAMYSCSSSEDVGI